MKILSEASFLFMTTKASEFKNKFSEKLVLSGIFFFFSLRGPSCTDETQTVFFRLGDLSFFIPYCIFLNKTETVVFKFADTNSTLLQNTKIGNL